VAPCGPNTKGGRLSARAAGGIIAAIAGQAALDDDPTGHVLRHPFATSLVRGQTDLIMVAELLGHSRLDTTRQYSLPTEQDKADALNHLTTTTEVTNRRSGPLLGTSTSSHGWFRTYLGRPQMDPCQNSGMRLTRHYPGNCLNASGHAPPRPRRGRFSRARPRPSRVPNRDTGP